MRMIRSASLLGVSIALFIAGATSASAALCPFCSAPALTLSEQLAQADAAALVQWVDGTKADEESPGKTIYEVVQALRTPQVVSSGDTAAKPIVKGDRITLDRFRSGKKGDLFLLMGTQGAVVEWGSPLEVTETGFNYVAQAPTPETAVKDRLVYFLRFLEYPDPLIGNDAYQEFANAPYKDIAELKDVLSRDRLQEWLESPDVPSTRIGLYGMMLGLCGNEHDALLLENKITEETDSYRIGIDGIIGGYLFLTGSNGLKVIEDSKLRDTSVPFSETYAAMQALRFMWSYGDGRVSKEDLRGSMRILLDRPELADLVIADLARWKDWSIEDRLMKMYDQEEYNIPSIKRAIVRYMLQAAKDGANKDDAKQPEHVLAAQKHLATLRESDAKTVQEAERFFFFN